MWDKEKILLEKTGEVDGNLEWQELQIKHSNITASKESRE